MRMRLFAGAAHGHDVLPRLSLGGLLTASVAHPLVDLNSSQRIRHHHRNRPLNCLRRFQVKCLRSFNYLRNLGDVVRKLILKAI